MVVVVVEDVVNALLCVRCPESVVPVAAVDPVSPVKVVVISPDASVLVVVVVICTVVVIVVVVADVVVLVKPAIRSMGLSSEGAGRT